MNTLTKFGTISEREDGTLLFLGFSVEMPGVMESEEVRRIFLELVCERLMRDSPPNEVSEATK